ncbi:hypothetical protein [Tautonia plasticadhaerens]|uniref:Uncharacterized protein n=1 Tax=Tautonia plasticadhaerens TaxID=2527974 RepID=A0A518GZN3_9BACT|nr:hypothetical protein [Tautonia plasticadhaerens]QDV34040.1 hypothetical protein ElP_19210 [Tautonia plasticadhaerens]
MPAVDFDRLVTLSDAQGRLLAELRRVERVRDEAYRALGRPAPNVPLIYGVVARQLARRRELLIALEELAERVALALGIPARRPLECEPCPPCPN